MSKRFTKIICTSVAAISLATLAFAPACQTKWTGVSVKDTSQYVAGTNGGFVTETNDYVYFINGKANNTDQNKFGSVLKGSVQRIKKDDLNGGNYSNTQTVVPSVIYSGSYKAGLYIYDGYIYYTTPSTQKNTDGEVLNSNLDFKRTKLDGTGTTDGYIWQSSDNAVDYRYVNVDGTVYILYALSENLYGTSVTNIHSVNCNTGKNTILAYNVAGYAFDTVDAENPYAYYTMSVPQFLDGSGTTYAYNQLYRVRADVTESPREYDFSDIEDYDASKNPVYINLGDYVFDGIGKVDYESGRVGQLNYSYHYQKDKQYQLINDPYTYEIKWYKDGVLYYNRKDSRSTNSLFTLSNEALGTTDGKIDASWDAVDKNKDQAAFISKEVSSDYTYCEIDGTLYAIDASSSGITRSPIENGKLGDALTVSDAASATVLAVREELGHTYLYYSVTGGNGYTVNRLAVDGSEDDYLKYPVTVDEELTYKSVKILDLDACSGWDMPEFVGNKLLYASEAEGMTSFNYVMVCDLQGANGIMTNKEIDELNDKFEGVTEKIEEYDKEENADGSKAYDGLSNALKYLWFSGDVNYIDELVKAYTDVLGKDKEYAYSEASVQIYKDYAAVTGDWEEYADDFKTINGEKVYANSRDYYYSVLGKMTDGDAKAMRGNFRTEYMKSYPVDDSTWWQGLSAGAKAGFIIGMVALGLLVIGGATVLTIFLIRRKRGKGEVVESKKIKIDITDDKDIDVYGAEEGEKAEEEVQDNE